MFGLFTTSGSCEWRYNEHRLCPNPCFQLDYVRSGGDRAWSGFLFHCQLFFTTPVHFTFPPTVLKNFISSITSPTPMRVFNRGDFHTWSLASLFFRTATPGYFKIMGQYFLVGGNTHLLPLPHSPHFQMSLERIGVREGHMPRWNLSLCQRAFLDAWRLCRNWAS